jgi:circadian clock protein KaiC
MKQEHNLKIIETGVPNLDSVLGGGVARYSMNIVSGKPGSGKTILVQQMMFEAAARDPDFKALFISTISEPSIKVLRYMQRMEFFDKKVFGERVVYRDLGEQVRKERSKEVGDVIKQMVDEVEPDMLVIDSFRAISDVAEDETEFRNFCFDLSVYLSTARCTTFLVEEYEQKDVPDEVEFAVADGIIFLDVAEVEDGVQRFVQVLKQRGMNPQPDPVPFDISSRGVRVLKLDLERPEEIGGGVVTAEPLPSGIPGLDEMLRGGLLRGRTSILSGVSGSGKTIASLQFLCEGASRGEKGLLFSFEETPVQLRKLASDFNLELKAFEEKGLIKVFYRGLSDIRVESDLNEIARQAEEYGPDRLVMDSFSVFLHRLTDKSSLREKTYQMVRLIRRLEAVGLLVSDIPAHRPEALSRFGVEETVADGVIVLSAETGPLARRRYIEVHKMRGVSHVEGRYRMEIAGAGIEVFYTKTPEEVEFTSSRSIEFAPISGITEGGLAYNSAWLVMGEPGIGKSTMAYEFAAEGLAGKEAVLVVSTDSPKSQVWRSMRNLGRMQADLEEGESLQVLDAYTAGDVLISDQEALLHEIIKFIERMPRPLRVVFDSLTPLALAFEPREFAWFVHRKNRLLRRKDVVVMDTMLSGALDKSGMNHLVNMFDVVMDLFSPDWGDMSVGQGPKALCLKKARGARVDTRPFPYSIAPEAGLAVQQDFYSRKMTG